MKRQDTSRLSRLTAILTQLQTKRVITATTLANKYKVSIRTIYRDIRALEEAGVPIFTEEGKGYSLMEDYRIPPVMFTEGEANALITAEKLVLKNKDTSLIKEYTEAINKVKAILKISTKDKANLLSNRILVRPQTVHQETSDTLSIIQSALTSFKVIQISYHAVTTNEHSQRSIEPFALYNNTLENWNLIAYCRLRKDFRLFRLDRITKISISDEHFAPHKLTLEEYVDIQRKKHVHP